MRSFVAGLAVFLAFLTGTAGLASYVVHDVVLDPSRAGEVVDYALHQPDTRREILGRTVPGYGRLPVRVRAAVDALADSPRLRRAARTISLDANGEVALSPLQEVLAAELRADQPRLAARVAAADTRVAVPARYVTRYDDARERSATLALRGGLATAALLLLALLVSPRRLRTVRSIGVAALLACLVVALLYWALPSVISAASSSPLVGAVVAVVQAERSTVLWRLAPFAGAGLVMLVVGLVAPRRA
jgi:hypothetical protein